MLSIEKFLDYLQYERGNSLLTIENYGQDLKDFEKFYKTIDAKLTWAFIDTDIVRAWVEEMMDRGNAPSSVNRRLSALRSFYKYGLKRNLVDRDPVYKIQGPKRVKPLPQFLKESEINQLLDKETLEKSYEDWFAKIIILTLYSTGIRLSELVGLNDKDVDFLNCELKVTGKRNKQRIIPFGEELKNELIAYQRKRDSEIKTKESSALFLTKKGQRVKSGNVREIVKKQLSSVSTLKKKTPHVLRHTFATVMLNHKAGLESVKKLLGHENLATTEIYTHTTFEQLREIYKDAHPRA